MRSLGRDSLLAAATALSTVAASPARAPAQLTATELGVGPVAVLAGRTFLGGELGVAHRPGTQGRIALTLGAGAEAGEAAGRAQLTLQFLVAPAQRGGVGLYAGLGAALAVRRSAPGRGYVAVLLGLEAAPGRRGGWYLEVGAAGGTRVAVGWRVRRFPAWWRQRGAGAVPRRVRRRRRPCAPPRGGSSARRARAAR